MNQISKQFTFGFEIEGLFHNDIISKINKAVIRSGENLRVGEKRDGSVDVRCFRGDWGELRKLPNDDELTTEMEIGVFASYDNMMSILSLFENEVNYWQNRTCGLHIHVGTRDPELRAKILNFGFINQLQEFAKEKLCSTIKQSRLKGNRFCSLYHDLRSAADQLRYGEKYKFMRKHDEYNTFEFRFFSPCQHKERNVEKFFEFFFDKLSNVKLKLAKEITLDEERKITKKVSVEEKNINIDLTRIDPWENHWARAVNVVGGSGGGGASGGIRIRSYDPEW